MKKFKLTMMLILVLTSSYAMNFKGAEITMVNLKNSQGVATDIYKFVVKCYSNNVANFGPVLTINTRLKNAGNSINTFGCVLTTTPQLITNLSNSCNVYPVGNDLYYAEYESTQYNMSSYIELDNYYVNFLDPNSNSYLNLNLNTNNIEHYTEFPRLNSSSQYKYNSSPVFNNHPIFFICNNNPVSFDYSATDVNGDSLSYSLVIPPSTNLVKNSFKTGYSISNYINGNSAIKINNKTGLITLNPNLSGNYFLAVKVEEFRNGQKIGEITRQHELTVLPNCGAAFTDIKPKLFLNNDSSITNLSLNVNNNKNILEVYLDAYDNGLIKDSLFIEIKAKNIGNDISKIDTSKYNWQILENGVFRNIGKTSATVSAKSKVTLRFKINLYPALFDSLLGNYNFAINIKDSKCAISNIDSGSISINFNKNPSIDTILDIYTKKGTDVTFNAIGTNLNGVKYQWQTDVGFGFQNLFNNNYYSNVDSQNLKVNNVQLRNHEQKFRCIINTATYIDSSRIAQIFIIDSAYIYIYDTIYVSITDTLKVKLLTGINGNNIDYVKIFPNPSTGKLYIKVDPKNTLQNLSYNIVNPLGQLIYSNDFNTNLIEIDLLQWTSKGVFLFNIIEKPSGKLIESKKIILE